MGFSLIHLAILLPIVAAFLLGAVAGVVLLVRWLLAMRRK